MRSTPTKPSVFGQVRAAATEQQNQREVGVDSCPSVGPACHCGFVQEPDESTPSAAANVNHAIRLAVLRVIEAWTDDDKAGLARANGLMTENECSLARSRAQQQISGAHDALAHYLPDVAYGSVATSLGNLAPRSNSALGETARRWRAPAVRVETANDILRTAFRHQKEAEARAEEELRKAFEAKLLAEEEARLRAERAARLAMFREEADEIFRRDFLGAEAWFSAWETQGQVTREDFDDWKAEFVQAWAGEVLGDKNLDFDQARAIATLGNDLRVIARAGSGKTRTIVTRALFLQLHCGVAPDEIALVAFNNKAVGEIGERIKKGLTKGAHPPHVVTFHALAYALLRPEEELVFDDEDAETHAQSAKVQAVVDTFLTTRQRDIRRAMLGFFEDDWNRIVKRGLHLDRDEFFEIHAGATKVTLGGDWVKSSGERLIANTLFTHGIDYKYERNFTKGGFNYRPDFTIFAGGKARVIVEYFGLKGDAAYDAKSAEKREFWTSQPDIAFLELSPQQIAELGQERFTALLLSMVRGAGVEFRALSENEIWERARKRGVDIFSKALKTFVGRARQLDVDPDAVRKRIHELGPDRSNRHFLDLATDVYEEYLARAASEGYEDFSGVMWRAAHAIRQGHVTWIRDGGKQRGDLRRLRFMHVDEFQDFSAMFMDFVRAIREKAPDLVLCGVGDDWQAINGFAGADLAFYEDFEDHFEGATTTSIATNYRSPYSVVQAGNTVMRGRGEPASPSREDKGSVQLIRLDDFAPTISEKQRFSGDVGTPALLRVVRYALDETGPNGKVIVLFRRNTVPWFTGAATSTFSRRLDGFLIYLRGNFTEVEGKRLDVTTAHKYKGREADCVIVADADDRAFPLIHPTAELFAIFGDTVDSLVAAERRLFYVATTRAESNLIYFVTTDSASRFLEGIRPAGPSLRWSQLPSAVEGTGEYVEVRVYDGYEIRETLKNTFKFTFDGPTSTWTVLRPAQDFDFAHVRRALAVIGPRLIEVRDEQGTVIHSAGVRQWGLTPPD